jgi:protoporphyrinogen oxidase
MISVPILILGAGPTGLGAAWRLHGARVSPDRWLLVDQAPGVGGCAGSFTDSEGFTFDLGGHVIHSHFPSFDEAVRAAIGDNLIDVRRNPKVLLDGRFVHVPFQSNLHEMDRLYQLRAFSSLIEAWRDEGRPGHLGEFFTCNFGSFLTETFFRPLNEKMWSSSLERIDHHWTSHRSGSDRANVPLLDLDVAFRNLVSGTGDPLRHDGGTFPFPAGGTGELWNRIAGLLPRGRIRLNTEIAEIDPHRKIARSACGQAIGYEYLISSMPLDRLLGKARGLRTRRLRTDLVHTSVTIACLGLAGAPPPAVRGVTWLYTADPSTPFFRGFFPRSFSDKLVPDPASTWSVMAEMSSSPAYPRTLGEDPATAAEQELRRLGLLGEGQVVSSTVRDLSHGYPVPCLGRDRILSEIQAELEGLGVFSRGRFGAWRYECSNQDHSFQQGIDAADAVLGLLGHPAERPSDRMRVTG